MKPKLATATMILGSLLCLPACSSLRKDNPTGYQDERGVRERVYDWYKRSQAREDEKFKRMFDRAAR